MQTSLWQCLCMSAAAAKGSPFQCDCGTNMAMSAWQSDESGRKPRTKTPLDEARLRDIALAYVARFATSAGRLEAYLTRKLRERGWAGEVEPDVAGLCARFAELGYIDDESFALARAGGLLRRGYGSRRIVQALNAAGIAEELRHAVRPAPREARQAALELARRRGFGPFDRTAASLPDPEQRRRRREKQIAAMIRAGHAFADAQALVDAGSVRAAETWADGEED